MYNKQDWVPELTPAKPIVILTINISTMLVRAQIGVNRLQVAVSSMATVIMCFPPKMSAIVPAGICVKKEP